MRHFSLFYILSSFLMMIAITHADDNTCEIFSGTYTFQEPCKLSSTPTKEFLWVLKIPSYYTAWNELKVGNTIQITQTGCNGIAFGFTTKEGTGVQSVIRSGRVNPHGGDIYELEHASTSLTITHRGYLNSGSYRGTRDTEWRVKSGPYSDARKTIYITFSDSILFDRNSAQKGSYTYAECKLIEGSSDGL